VTVTADPVADLAGYRQHVIWLSQDEILQLIENLRALILPVLANEPAPDRGHYRLSAEAAESSICRFPCTDPRLDAAVRRTARRTSGEF
jgi:hypothetical protein